MPAAMASTFVGVPIVVTEKLDGGNCCITVPAAGEAPRVYARTHSHEATHDSFGPIKTLALEMSYSGYLEPGVKLFGENMFGIHSIEYVFCCVCCLSSAFARSLLAGRSLHRYDDLDSFFYLFAVQLPDGACRVWRRSAVLCHAGAAVSMVVQARLRRGPTSWTWRPSWISPTPLSCWCPARLAVNRRAATLHTRWSPMLCAASAAP